MIIDTEKKPVRGYLIIGIIALVFLAIGIFGGYKWKERIIETAPPQHSIKIDSLNEVIRVLEDSIALLDTQAEEADRVIVKWKTKYDTITLRPPTDLSGLVKGLNEIANTPIQ